MMTTESSGFPPPAPSLAPVFRIILATFLNCNACNSNAAARAGNQVQARTR